MWVCGVFVCVCVWCVSVYGCDAWVKTRLSGLSGFLRLPSFSPLAAFFGAICRVYRPHPQRPNKGEGNIEGRGQMKGRGRKRRKGRCRRHTQSATHKAFATTASPILGRKPGSRAPQQGRRRRSNILTLWENIRRRRRNWFIHSRKSRWSERSYV